MGTLKCGAAIRDITPPLELIPYLRGLTACRYGGIRDNLKVRAVAFEDCGTKAVIVQLDLDKDQAPNTVLPEISSRFGVPEENILYFGIHTHSAPMFTGRHEIGANPPPEVIEGTHKYEEIVFAAIYEAVGEAFNNLREAKIGCGKQNCYVNVRRVEDFYTFDENGTPSILDTAQGGDPAEPMSHEFFVMSVRDMEDKPIAFLMNYPMHCVVMFLNGLCEDGTSLISGDVAGNVSQYIEAKFPGAVAIWSSGAAGDANPLPNSFGTYVDPLTGKLEHFSLKSKSEELLKYLAAQQYSAAMRAIAGTEYYSQRGGIDGYIGWSNNPCYANGWDSERGRPIVDTGTVIPDGYRIRVQFLRIGDVQFIGIGGELFNSFAEEFKAISPLKNTVVINHNASLISDVSYIFDDDAIYRGYSPVQLLLPGHIGPSLMALFREYLSK